MQIITDYRQTPPELKGSVIALGNFDGVHRGHRGVLERARAEARSLNAPFGVMTFEPHPRSFFRPGEPTFRLTSLSAKIGLLAAQGVEVMFNQHFDEEFSGLSAEEFVSDVLVQHLNVRHVAAGRDFQFGRDRSGNQDLLKEMGKAHGFIVDSCDAVLDESGEVISSSRIRNALRQGQPHEAEQLLGHPWAIDGVVIQGDQRGRKLGFPTANIDMNGYLWPAFGVYAARIHVKDGPQAGIYGGAVNIGIRPMYQVSSPLLEAHLFDFSGDLYGRPLAVQIAGYLREELKFDSVDALVQQMKKDCSTAKQLLSRSASTS